MRKWFCLVISALLLLTLSACDIPSGAPESSAPAPRTDLQEAALIAAVKANLGVPDTAGITYEIGEKFFWDAAQRHYKTVTFYEYGDKVATAAVDPTSGEPLKSIAKYQAPPSTPVRDAFIKVLTGEYTFTVKNGRSGKGEKRKLDHFAFATEYAAQIMFVPAQYAFVDMNGDKIFEMVVADLKLDFFLVLRYAGGGVCGYVIPHRSLMDLRADGLFRGSEGAAISSIGRMSFKNLEYAVTELAYMDQQKGVYRLNGATSDKASVEAYYKARENIPAVKWIKIEA